MLDTLELTTIVFASQTTLALCVFGFLFLTLQSLLTAVYLH